MSRQRINLQPFIDDVLNRVDIIDVIDARIKLRKKGANYQACCPFHQEKTPSFSVHPIKQFYHCFGCAESGNALTFLMKFEGLTFMEALRQLAAQVGLNLPEGTDTERSVDQTPLFEVLLAASQYYQQQLRHTPRAIDYLKKRGITGKIAKAYGIGYAPAGWDNLFPALQNNPQITRAALVEAGLNILKEDRYYDRFRDRIIFPILDKRGRVIAFGGRVIDQGEPKYLNSPETPVFHKSDAVYGLYQARQALKQLTKVILVEGYLDVIALAQHGIPYAVATLGTATTTSHLQILLRLCDEIIFCYDGDSAGQKAALKAFELVLPLLADNKQFRFLLLAPSDDPDSFIRRVGKTDFEKALASAVPLSDYFFSVLDQQVDPSHLESKAHQAQIANTYFNKMPNCILKGMLEQRVSERLRLPVQQTKQAQPAFTGRMGSRAMPIMEKKLSPLRLALAMLLQHPNLASRVDISEVWLDSQREGIPLLKTLLIVLAEHPDYTSAHLLEHWRDTPEQNIIASLLKIELLVPENGLFAEFDGVLNNLRATGREELIEQLLDKASRNIITITEKKQLQALIANKIIS